MDIIDRYAQAYGVLPRIVRQEKMDDVIPMLAKWQQQKNYQDRYREIEDESKPR